MRTLHASVNAQFGAALVVGPLSAPDLLGENPDWILDGLAQPAVLSFLVQDHLSALEEHVTGRSSGGVLAVGQGLTDLVNGLAGGATIGSTESTALLSQDGYSLDAEGGGSLSGTGYSLAGFPDSGTGEPDSNEQDAAGTGAPSGAPTELLVQFAPGVSAAVIARAAAAIGGQIVETIHTSAMIDAGAGVLVRMTIGAGVGLEQAIQGISHRPGVEFAEPNWGVSVDVTSDDPAYKDGTLWGMHGDKITPHDNEFGSQADEAWETGYVGSFKTVAGVVDTGIDYTHPDLYLNVWLNQNEIPEAFKNDLYHADSDGLITFWDLNHANNKSFVADVNRNGYIDAGDLLADTRWANKKDESLDPANPGGPGNGYVDDLIGWDFVNNDNDPYDDHGHGTHVSGTIGGVGGNGTGVAGVAWDVQLMGLKFLNASGSGSLSNAIKALDYYTTAGTLILTQDFVATNNSWGGGGFSQALLDSIVRGAMQDVLFVAAAGNGGRNGRGDDNDSTAHYPSNYDTTEGTKTATSPGYDVVIAVASITSSGSLSTFSNYGKVTVDLGAPGQSIYSTLPGGYGTYSGTSMATPHVTGAIALYGAATEAGAMEIKSAILGSTAPTESLLGKTVTDGRLDAGTLMNGTVTPGPVVTVNTLVTNDTTPALTGTVEATATSVEVTVGLQTLSAYIIGDGTWSLSNDLLSTLDEGVYDVAARATDAGGNVGNDRTTGELTIDTTPPTAPTVNALTTSDTTPTVSGQATLAAGETISVHVAGTNYAEGSGLIVSGSDWSLTVGTALKEGTTYDVTATVTDAAGNWIQDATAGELVIDAAASGGSVKFGTDGSDTLAGTEFDDTISGLPKPEPDSTALGEGTVDVLAGLGGADTFIFGDKRGAFYDDDNPKAGNNGKSDYGQIDDFSSLEGDKIQLFGAAADYLLAPWTQNGVSGTGIFWDSNGDGAFDSKDELIGLVQVKDGKLVLDDDTQFSFVTSDDVIA